ncbi:MAG: Rieske 2Fe-2S domain-containing protein [Chloroherpetonaceae bacterium]
MNRREFLSVATSIVGSSLFVGCDASSSSALPTPKAPTDISVRDSLSDIVVSWSAVTMNTDNSLLTDLQNYRVYRAQIPSRPFDFVANVPPDTLSWRDTSLQPGDIRYYKVKAINARGIESDFSPESQSISLSIRVQAEHLPSVGQALFLNRNGAIVPSGTPRSDLTLTRFGEMFIALSRFCTHAGCSNMRFENLVWTCFCHGSQFSQQGQVLGSPAQTDLERYHATRQPDGSVIISFSVNRDE